MTALPEGFPKIKGEGVWNCRKDDAACTRKQPCNSCRGARNRRKGKRRQNGTLRVFEDVCDVRATWAGKRANEETYDHLPIRNENKAGHAGGANAVGRHYLASEGQSEANRAIGDLRPFLATFSPDGMGDDLFVGRMSLLPQIIEAIVMSANRPEGSDGRSA